MQGLAKLLVIEDDPAIRQHISTIMEFVGESCEMFASSQCERIDWSSIWTGCILGTFKDQQLSPAIKQHLQEANHIPLLKLDKQPYSLDEFCGYLGDLELPLNYPQLTEALRHCKGFTGYKKRPSDCSDKLFQSLVGQSFGIREVRHLIEQVARTDANVLILGESGTGKEVVAKNIHSHSSRNRGPFVPINCGAIPGDLLESELFGHEKGAFTGALTSRKGRFELAEGGTLFLDEIGDMPMAMQVKLLRVLQERCFERVGGNTTIKVNVRVVAATHRNLESMIAQESFREDLFYRLNVFPIEMPALKHRKEDIPLLLNELLRRIEVDCGGASVRFTPRAIRSLMEHDWPGNVRELANLVERMIILYPDSLVDVNHLPVKYRYGDVPEFKSNQNNLVSIEEQERDVFASIFSEDFNFKDVEQNIGAGIHAPDSLPPEGINLKEVLADLEVSLIHQALDAQDGIVARAADMLGMRRTTLVEKMKKYNMNR